MPSEQKVRQADIRWPKNPGAKHPVVKPTNGPNIRWSNLLTGKTSSGQTVQWAKDQVVKFSDGQNIRWSSHLMIKTSSCKNSSRKTSSGLTI